MTMAKSNATPFIMVVDPLMIAGHKISSKEVASYLVSSSLPWLDLIAAYMRVSEEEDGEEWAPRSDCMDKIAPSKSLFPCRRCSQI
ncbi:unnamed protein product [Urochloa humidicola]